MEPQVLFQKAVDILKFKLAQADDEKKSTYTDIVLPNGRSHFVWLYPHTCKLAFHDADQVIIYAEARIGFLNEKVEPLELLKSAENLVLTRIQVLNDDERTIAVQGCMPLGAITPELLADLIYEVAVVGDSLEERLFGVDKE
jgi:hypothetical protein